MAYTYLNASNWSGMFSYANGITSHWFGNILLLTFFFVLYISMKDYTSSRAFGAASFITTLVSLLLWAGGIASMSSVIISSVITAIALVTLVNS